MMSNRKTNGLRGYIPIFYEFSMSTAWERTALVQRSNVRLLNTAATHAMSDAEPRDEDLDWTVEGNIWKRGNGGNGLSNFLCNYLGTT